MRTWKYQCGKCKHIYHSPLELTYCSHKCTPISKPQEMKLIKEEETTDE